jgi:hypothetical protein
VGARESLRRALGGLVPPQPAEPRPPALTGAAHVLKLGRDRITPAPQQWQKEAWEFYGGRLGQFTEGVDWLSRAISRVRLVPARQKGVADEPEPLDSGPAVDLVGELAGGTDGQAQMLATLATHFTVPGESWLTGERTSQGVEWVVRSSDEIREGRTKNARGERIPEVIDDASATSSRVQWRSLAPLDGDEWNVIKLWSRDKRFRHLPSSPAKAALPDLRRLELVNRRIDADLLSRLAMNGLLLVPNEVTFPVRPEFQDEPDPFVAELIETAREAIATPGTAAAAIPIPLKMPGEWLDKVKHVTFASPLDERLLELWATLVRGIATTLHMPAEYLTGVGDLNHWSLSQLGEDALKEYVAPAAELICHSLTRGYLWPMLGEGEHDEAVWYDLSELAQRPDRSKAAGEAYDRAEISAEAYRREVGFDEDDKPNDQELRDQLLRIVVRTQPTLAQSALAELGVMDAPEPAAAPAAPVPAGDEERPADGPPDTRDAPPPQESAPPARAASLNGTRR